MLNDELIWTNYTSLDLSSSIISYNSHCRQILVLTCDKAILLEFLLKSCESSFVSNIQHSVSKRLNIKFQETSILSRSVLHKNYLKLTSFLLLRRLLQLIVLEYLIFSSKVDGTIPLRYFFMFPRDYRRIPENPGVCLHHKRHTLRLRRLMLVFYY